MAGTPLVQPVVKDPSITTLKDGVAQVIKSFSSSNYISPKVEKKLIHGSLLILWSSETLLKPSLGQKCTRRSRSRWLAWLPLPSLPASRLLLVP